MTQLPSRERLEGITRGEKCYTHDDVVQVVRALLAAHEQEPIGAFHISGGTVEATTDYCKDGEWPVQDGIVEVYARPAPVPAVPAKWPEKLTWSHHDDMTQAEVLAWNNAIDACRSALLNGRKS